MLDINVDKSNVMMFSRKKNSKPSVLFNCNGSHIKLTKSYTYLGFNISSNGKFQLLQKTLVGKASRALFSLYRIPGFKNLSICQQLQLYDSLIKPILLYGSEVWGLDPLMKEIKLKGNNISFGSMYNKWEAQKTTNKYFRGILGLHSKAPLLPILGDLGKYPTYVDIIGTALKLWMKTMREVRSDSLLHKAMLETYTTHHAHNNYNFVSAVRDILLKFSFREVWENNGGRNIVATSKMIKKFIEVDFVKFWNEEISNANHSRYLFYNKIKYNFKLENYLVLVDDPAFRTCISKLRTSTHSLLIEKGRHLNIDRKDRLCPECRVIEDEEHFLFECSKFKSLRQKYINDLNPNNLGSIFNNSLGSQLVGIAKFIKCATELS